IRCVQSMRALTAYGRVVSVAIPPPALFELAVDQIVGVDDHPRVRAATDEQARPFAVKRSDSNLVAIYTVASVVSPILGIASLHPIDFGDFLACHAIPDGAILRSGYHESVSGPILFRQRFGVAPCRI